MTGHTLTVSGLVQMLTAMILNGDIDQNTPVAILMGETLHCTLIGEMPRTGHNLAEFMTYGLRYPLLTAGFADAGGMRQVVLVAEQLVKEAQA